MTPHQLAKAECADMDTDGMCMMIEPSSWHDYRVPLPDWLSADRWVALVNTARERGETMISTTNPRTMITVKNPRGQRLDLYYCPGCGTRMGVDSEKCPPCKPSPIIPDDVDRQRLENQGVEPDTQKVRVAYCKDCDIALPLGRRSGRCEKCRVRQHRRRTRERVRRLRENQRNRLVGV